MGLDVFLAVLSAVCGVIGGAILSFDAVRDWRPETIAAKAEDENRWQPNTPAWVAKVEHAASNMVGAGFLAGAFVLQVAEKAAAGASTKIPGHILCVAAVALLLLGSIAAALKWAITRRLSDRVRAAARP